MKLYQRYLNGENKAVYNEILELGQTAFLPENRLEIEAILNETLTRVAHNLEVIYQELKSLGYLFRTKPIYREKPLEKPLPNVDVLLKQLDKIAEPYGYVPLSIKKFYQIVGACDFVWDYRINEKRFWDCADPIEIIGLDAIIPYITDGEWEEMMEEVLEENEKPYLELAADYLHKDNISGGMPYSIAITKNPSIDGLFLFEPHNTTFIDYLRICFENCGFSLISEAEIDSDYKSFFSRVKPQMLKI